MQRSAALKLDWNKISTGLNLKGQTAASLAAFKSRNDEVRRKLSQLNALPQTIDFKAYRDTLKNTAIVDDIENKLKTFKPKTYDVSKQIKALAAFEVQAVKSAEETKEKVDAELVGLTKCLDDISKVREWEHIELVSIFQCYFLRITGLTVL